jgi:hypothetical protein
MDDFTLALPVLAVALAIFASWRILRRKTRGRSVRLNFDAAKEAEMRRIHLGMILAMVLMFPVTVQAEDAKTPPQKGTAIVTDANGNRTGYVNPGGTVTDNYGRRVGYISPSGTLTDPYGNKVGQINKPK